MTVRPSLFLEAALASNDSQVLAAVLRFFSDFTPGFKTTSDCRTYNRILNEMNSAVAVWMSTSCNSWTLKQQLPEDSGRKYFHVNLFCWPCFFLFETLRWKGFWIYSLMHMHKISYMANKIFMFSLFFGSELFEGVHILMDRVSKLGHWILFDAVWGKNCFDFASSEQEKWPLFQCWSSSPKNHYNNLCWSNFISKLHQPTCN